jgi:hypothetical protein
LLPAIAQRLRNDLTALDGATSCAPKDKRHRHERNCQT